MTKIETKKLDLNKTKCHQLHVGTHNDFCPQLKTHEDIMLKVDEDSYLGDTVMATGSNSSNIKNRCGRGLGIISNIMIILKETCLGEFYFTVAVILRETII